MNGRDNRFQSDGRDRREKLADRGAVSALVAGAFFIIVSMALLGAAELLSPFTAAAVIAAILIAEAAVVGSIIFYKLWVRSNRYAGRPDRPHPTPFHLDPHDHAEMPEPPRWEDFGQDERPSDRP